MTPTTDDDRSTNGGHDTATADESEAGRPPEAEPERRARSRYPRFLDWLVPIVLVLIGLALVVGGTALLAGADEGLIREAVQDETIQSDVFTGEDLVDVTFATAWWSGIGLVVTGVTVWLAAVWFYVLRRRERRLEAEGGRPSYVWTNAIVGGVAAIVLGFIPFSQAVGGAIAGWLQASDRDTNLKVGGLSGLLTGLPIALAVVFVFAGLIDGSMAVEDGNWAFLWIGVLAFVVVFTLLFVAVLGAIGGWIGGRIAGEPADRA
jgi:hypothetical protein